MAASHGADGRAQSVRDVHGRAVRDGNRERPAGWPLTPGPTTISSAACRPHVRTGEPARQDGREGRRDRVQRDDGARSGPPRRRRALDPARSHRGRELHRPRGRHGRPAARARDRARGPARDPAATSRLKAQLGGRGRRRARAPEQRLEIRDDIGDCNPEDRRRPLARVPRGSHPRSRSLSPPRPAAPC